MSYDTIIYGKNNIENVVCVEVTDNYAELFIEKNGAIQTQTIPNKHWILFSEDRRLSSLYKKGLKALEGSNKYKYILPMEDRETFTKARTSLKKDGFDVWSVYDAKESYMLVSGVTYFKGMKIEDISVLSFDIETNGLSINNKSQIYCISNTFRKNGILEKKLFSVDEYFGGESEMLQSWMDWVKLKDPSIMLGHNIFSYDLPFIANRLSRLGLNFSLGRDGSNTKFNEYTSEFRKDGSQSYEYTNAYIYGREIIDTMFLSIKYDVGRKYESYGLKNIIKEEGMEKQGRVFIDASKISEEWKDINKRKLIKQYAMDDSDDALKLFDFMAPSFFYMTQSIPKSFQQVINTATGSQLNAMMVRSYLQEGYSIPEATEASEYEGGISFGIPGYYNNVKKVDLTSAYPSTIIQYEMYDKTKDPKARLLYLTKYFFEQRLKYKKLGKESGEKYYKDMDASFKILINSLYGFCGAKGLAFNAPHIAAEITRKCRGYIDQAIMWATNKPTDYWKAKIKDVSDDE